jgi:hypothetical protein
MIIGFPRRLTPADGRTAPSHLRVLGVALVELLTLAGLALALAALIVVVA